MNKSILMGRLTKDPEVKQTPNGVAVCSFTVAVDRPFKTQDGQRQTDFISCVAWRQQATLLGNYFHKGSRIAIVGSIQSRSFDDQNGQKRYVQEVVVDEIEFVDTKADSNNSQTPPPTDAQAPTQRSTRQPAQVQSNRQPAAQAQAQAAQTPPLPPPAQQVDPGFEVESMEVADEDPSLPFDVLGF